jgi:hypothetical protein
MEFFMTRNEFREVLRKSDFKKRQYEERKIIDAAKKNDQKKAINKINKQLLSKIDYESCTVLGLDLYGYSKFENDKQTLIPFIFDLIYQKTKKDIDTYEKCFFAGYSFDDNLISTGDGCFQLFKNPIQAIIFNINFFTTLHRYNASRFYPEFYVYIGELLFRSCITTGKIFTYEKNHYGSAIITNARILSKDKLNRFLIDADTYKWFLLNIDGVENISEITLEELSKILKLKSCFRERTAIFRTKETFNINQDNKYGREYGKVKSCHVQKIGDISAKSDSFSVYNIELQVYVYFFDPKRKEIGSGMVVSIGNSNNSGIID